MASTGQLQKAQIIVEHARGCDRSWSGGIPGAKNELGLVYPAKNIPALLQQLRQLPRPDSKPYQHWHESARDFAKGSRLEVFQAQLAEHLAPTARSLAAG
jgi:hypothetical protein